MKIADIKNLNECDYIVLLPKYDCEIKDSVNYMFGNVIELDESTTEEEAKQIINFVNSKCKKLFIFSFDNSYRLILPFIKKAIVIKAIYKNNLAKLTDYCVRNVLNGILEFYDRNIISEIGCLDYSTFYVLKNKYNAKHLLLDIKVINNSTNFSSNTIGLLGNDYDPNHNTYNLLSAVKMVDYDKIKMLKIMPATDHFIDFFNIKEEKVDNIEDVLKNNFVNLYVNFTSTNIELILKSMDSGVPCLLGNVDIFDEYPKLKELLVVESDDDIREIKDKINNIKTNAKVIKEEYNKFREDYIEKSKKSISEFIQ